MRITIAVLLFTFFCTIHPCHGQVEAFLEGRWFDTTLVASIAHNNTYNEIWGLAHNGREYAVIGSTRGTHFIDVTSPSGPVEVAFVKGGTTGAQIIHRDYHDFAGYLYAVADEGAQSTLQIIDYSPLPDSVQVVYDSKQLIRRAHNIFIDTATAIMYGCITSGDSLPFTPLRLFDLSDPVNPVDMASYNFFDGNFVSQVHDMFIRDHKAFLNCGPGGLIIADFSDPYNPVTLATLSPSEYPQSGYNHSGWLSEDGQTYYMADENHGADMKVLDVSNLPEITVLDTIDAGSSNPLSIPHNQIVLGPFLFVSYYYDGLQVYYIDDPQDVRRVAYFPTSQIEARARYEGAWGVYPFLPSGLVLVSDMQEGLFVIQLPTDLVSTQDHSQNADWGISPNPSNGSFVISGMHINDETEVSVFSNTGKICYKGKWTPALDLDLRPGMYYVLLRNGSAISTKPLIIVH